MSGLEQDGAAAADPAVVLDADHQPVLAGQLDERGVDRLDPARVDDGDADALGGEPLGDLDGGRWPSRRRRRRARRWVPLRTSTSTPPARSTASMSVGRRALGEAHDGRGVVDLDGLVEQLAQPGAVAGRGEPQAGHDLEDRHVPHAVVAGAVVAGDAGAVEHERDAAPVQRDVHQHLVEGPVEEGRVDRDDRVQAAHRQARRREVAACCSAMPTSKVRSGNRCGELVEADRVHHRRGDRDDVLAALRRCATISSAKTSVQIRPLGVSSPVSTSNGPGWWNWSASCRSAAS